MKTNKLPPLEYLKECFVLDSSLPNGIRWVSDRPLSHFNSEAAYKLWNKKYSNKPCGCRSDNGYFHTAMFDKNYRNHRIVYAIANNTNDFQDFQIDHIDNNKLNNNPENLRLATCSQNKFNTGKQKNNTSGYKNIFFIKKTQKYISTVKINRKSIHIGTFETLELAIEARDEKIKEIAKDFYKS
jgi:hypothetical protein